MLIRFPTVALFAGAVIIALPASAKVSVSRARQICEGAAKVLQPPPKSVQVDKEEMQTSGEWITIFLNVRTAEDAIVKVSCVVDRETSMATLTPSKLASSTVSPAPAQ